MKKISIFLLLAAFFMPLAMNAQTRTLKNSKIGFAKSEMSTQNEMFIKSPVQIPNLESRNYSLANANNATGNRITRDGAEYEMVTTSQSDWSGNYVMAVPFSETVGYGFDGTIDDNTGGIAQVTLENYTSMTSIGDAAVLTIAPSTDYPSYYTIKINGGDYLADGTSGLETSSTETDYTNWDISLTSDGMQLYNPVWSGGPYYLYFLYFENESSNSAGAFWLTDDGSTYYDGVVEGYTFEYIFPYLYKEVSSGSGYTDCDYEKVTASQTDWSGDYVITYVNGTTANVLTGKASGGNFGDYTTATITDNTLANADVAAYNVTIEPVTYNNATYYTIKQGDNYLYLNTNGNYLCFGTTIPTNNSQRRYYWTIAYSGSTLTITNYASTVTSNWSTRRLLWNNQNGSQRFACYTGTSTNVKNISLFKKLTDCEPPCPAPTNLTYSNVTGEGATLAWDGEADSYSIHIGSAPKTYDFEDGSLQGWSAVDNDGDGASWFVMDNDTYSGSHGGDYYVFVSYNDASAVDDWLISPQVQLGGSISFWIKKLNNSSYHDYYRVYVSTTNTDISSFTEITSGTIEPATSYSKVSYDLSSYSGAGYIAIRHTAAADQAYLFVDDITIVEGGQTIPNATSPYTVTGLNPATEYVWQVMGDCGDGDVSQWSTSSTFTTLDLCVTPTDLSSADITNNSAALSWTGLADAYDIQYREYDATAPVTVILTAGSLWSDGSGYQMLLDADATAFGSTIPETGPLTSSGDASAATYAEFEYKIPTNADGSCSTSNIVVNNSISIQIPAGTYDWCITNPTPNDRVWIAGTSGNVGGRQNDYVFEAGMTYEFVVSTYGTGDGVDVTITADWTTVSGVTNPYPLTGLNPGTTYAWQVQGEDCDNWSASNVFTTLNGILVTEITADDVEVLVGETASITNLVVEPSDATNPAVTYTSADETVATVDASGVVTGVGVGTTTITIAATDGSEVTGTINVTVTGIDVTAIEASDVTVVNGQTATISYTVTPNNATDASVTFTSADPTIATVDADGVVTGVSVGETTITIASVSNPDVTTTITVTVTSNPNAVQFTVNAPANAYVGQTITVEGVLAAPTSGTWNGFTALILDINYDNTAFEYVENSITNGPVATQAQQTGAMITPGTLDNAVQLAIIAWSNNVTTEGVVFSAQFTVLEGAAGEYTFTAVPHENNLSYETELLPYEVTPSDIVIGNKYVKHIDGYHGENGGYWLIAPPIDNVNPANVYDENDPTLNMLCATGYDLYYFDNNPSDGLEWINYRSTPFNLALGKGYLYASNDDIDLTFIGTGISDSEYSVTLTIGSDNTSERMRNFNLVGNPFPEDHAYLADGRAFYTMQDDGTLIAQATTSNSIETMEGIFVKAIDENDVTLTFTKTAPAKSGKGLVLDLTQGTSLIDRAVVRFDEIETLPKFQIKRNSTKVYIPMEGEDYAVVRSEEMGEMPVSFKAEENGSYTLNFSALNTEFGYLHLIDNMTGNDVDLLTTPSYSFNANTTDYENRFKLVFATGEASDDNFAFFSNGSFVINNEGDAVLEVIDVTGRIIESENINGCANVNVNAAAGVYMLRLVNGDNVKVQKVVVR